MIYYLHLHKETCSALVFDGNYDLPLTWQGHS